MVNKYKAEAFRGDSGDSRVVSFIVEGMITEDNPKGTLIRR